MRVFTTCCRECGSKSVIKKTEWKDAGKCLLAVHYIACTNVECGHTFVMKTEFSHTLSPGARAVERLRKNMPSMLEPQQQQFVLDLLSDI
ncbi:TPA: ogr/Delta-like zinc finger family protein [Enterobacter kobei]|nr:ogr/Delta-like zinc finger family protein [Enterobacter kobei]